MWPFNIFSSGVSTQSPQRPHAEHISAVVPPVCDTSVKDLFVEGRQQKFFELPSRLNLSIKMPTSIDELRSVRRIGGSTGALLMQDPLTKKKFVKKSGMSPEHITNEYNVLALYAACGVRVPQAKLYKTSEGISLLTVHVPGKTLAETISHLADRIADPEAAYLVADIRQFFVADALLGAWDVLGSSYDNIIVDTSGLCWRVDFGCGLSFRARGAPKSLSLWNERVLELNSMRDMEINVAAGCVFKNIGNASIKKQIKDLAEKRELILYHAPTADRDILGKRLSFLNDYAAGNVTL